MNGRPDKVLRIIADPVVRSFENGSVVLLRPELPDWIRTTDAGAWIFEQLRAEPRSAERMVEAVARKYGLPDEVVRGPTLRLLEALVDQGYATGASGTEELGGPARPVPPRVEDLGLRQLWLHVTSRCNLRCRHCYYPVEQPGRDLPVEVARRLFDEAAALGVGSVVLSGGEPMLHPRILDLAEACREASTWAVKVVTNGTIPDDELFDRVVARVDDLQVSIDGTDAPTHDAVRGAGSFARAVAAFKRLHDTDARVRRGVAFTPMSGNLDRIAELPKLAYQLGADYIHLNHGKPPADPANREAMAAEGFFRPDFIRRAVVEFRRLSVSIISDRKDTQGLRYRPLSLDASFGFTLPLIQTLHQDNCGAGVTTLAFDPDGSAYPCAALAGRAGCDLGRFPAASLDEIRRSGAAWNRGVFSVERDPACSACIYRHFCGGGCRALGAVPGDRDPSCGVLYECYDEFFQYVSVPGNDEFSRLAAQVPAGKDAHARADGCAEA